MSGYVGDFVKALESVREAGNRERYYDRSYNPDEHYRRVVEGLRLDFPEASATERLRVAVGVTQSEIDGLEINRSIAYRVEGVESAYDRDPAWKVEAIRKPRSRDDHFEIGGR